MIKVNELRIGNWIQFNNFIQPKKYIQTNASFFRSWLGGRNVLEIRNDEEINDLYSPIPLTEELLLKFGFQFNENKGQEYIDEDGVKQIIEDAPYWYVSYEENKRFCVYLTEKVCYISIPCIYVHQLQNAFFVVAGEELKIRLNN